MEGLLILIGIYVLDIAIKKVAAGKKKQQNQRREAPPDDEFDSAQENEQQHHEKPRSLQDLIRQFEEAQREASGGTLTPAAPPVEELEDEFDINELPVVTPAKPGEFTFSEIAESVVQWEIVNVEMLQNAFGFSEIVARQVLHELQAKRIVGRDMGDGDCDLLIHDKVELDNHFKRLQREAEEQQAAAAQEAALRERREAELKHQKELAELEERASQLREQASRGTLPLTSEDDILQKGSRLGPRASRLNKDEIRRGFIWAKVLDEPRFKRRWSARVR